jgi:maltooligosyltrehalose trehalohydrolase
MVMRRAAPAGWRPTLGAWCVPGGASFRVWAPEHGSVEVVIGRTARPLARRGDGSFAGVVPGIGAGARYAYRVDGAGPFPDPASRSQPDGVHGLSQIVDPSRFTWSDRRWRGIARRDLVIYELHVGTFTAAGTFAAAAQRLPALHALGITAIELMPVADCPGERNWGYDGVALFAPARRYGTPDDLRRLIDRAHRLGLAVLLDVVYNHVGPDGAYLSAFSRDYFSARHRTPWGAAVNFDGRHSAMVRAFLAENALYWLHEFHVDGLRLDATHALIDDSPRHFLAELAARVRRAGRPAALSVARRPLLIAEDHRHLAVMLRSPARGGWGIDAVWADDFHHQMRRALAGDHEGFFADYRGTMSDIAATLQRGWFHRGPRTPSRGTDPAGLAPDQFIICLQNHDQVGNRAFGERLHHQIDAAAYRAASALLLAAPEVPLLFMGQEWATRAPFRFFTDHRTALGRLVTRGRRAEFKAFAAFSDPHRRARIPNPQDRNTFAISHLDWRELRAPTHAAVWRLYRALLALRRREPLLRAAGWRGFRAIALDDWGIALVRRGRGANTLVIVAALLRGGTADLSRFGQLPRATRGRGWRVVLQTESRRFALDPTPIRIDQSLPGPVLHFARPGAVVLRLVHSAQGAGRNHPRASGRQS